MATAELCQCHRRSCRRPADGHRRIMDGKQDEKMEMENDGYTARSSVITGDGQRTMNFLFALLNSIVEQ
uniref:Uncharacterized protein n=1 Tax=Syphacia muris TaxID=451379 RepID=A0A0N5AW66_9BILA